MRCLIIDVGNTHIKYGYFVSGVLEESDICTDWTVAQWSAFHIANPFNIVFVGSDSTSAKHFLAKLPTSCEIQFLNQDIKYPFTSAYKNIQTLGIDRRAALTAAMYSYPKTAVLIIDAGSCITYDFISSDGHHLGGAISPGRAMRYKSMHLFTEKLPLLEPEKPNPSIGISTEGSMQVGVEVGVVAEIQVQIDVFAQRFGDFTIILTGGDANFLIKKIKKPIFADTDFILNGLYHLLMFNTLNEK